MANQFYVGQRVRSEKYGEGEVLNVSSNRHPGFPVYCSFKNSGMGYSLAGVLIGGSDIDLTPIDPPRTVMTDWQRKQLSKCHWLNMSWLEKILSEPFEPQPEPPKFEPKEGEAVLVRDLVNHPWKARVFSSMTGGGRYYCYTDTTWKYCRPFDAALVEKVTD